MCNTWCTNFRIHPEIKPLRKQGGGSLLFYPGMNIWRPKGYAVDKNVLHCRLWLHQRWKRFPHGHTYHMQGVTLDVSGSCGCGHYKKRGTKDLVGSHYFGKLEWLWLQHLNRVKSWSNQKCWVKGSAFISQPSNGSAATPESRWDRPHLSKTIHNSSTKPDKAIAHKGVSFFLIDLYFILISIYVSCCPIEPKKKNPRCERTVYWQWQWSRFCLPDSEQCVYKQLESTFSIKKKKENSVSKRN